MLLPSAPPPQFQVSCTSCLICPAGTCQPCPECECCCHLLCVTARLCPDLGKDWCSEHLHKAPLCRLLDQLYPPFPSPAENKPRLNVSVTSHKGVLCLQGALLLRCQAVWSQWQMENPTQRSPDLPWHKSKQVDLIFPLQHIPLLMDSQFRDKLHCTLGFRCVSALFPWQ